MSLTGFIWPLCQSLLIPLSAMKISQAVFSNSSAHSPSYWPGTRMNLTWPHCACGPGPGGSTGSCEVHMSAEVWWKKYCGSQREAKSRSDSMAAATAAASSILPGVQGYKVPMSGSCTDTYMMKSLQSCAMINRRMMKSQVGLKGHCQNIYVYKYTYMHVCVCVCMCVYTYIYTRIHTL